MRIAVACASGSAKGVFVHGVLSAFQERGVPVEAYAASSSATIPAAFAAAGALADLEGAAHWQRGAEKLRELKDVTEMVKWGIAEVCPALKGSLFVPTATRFILAASHVASAEAAETTQGSGAKRLGLDQLRAMKMKDLSWADANLACHLFDTMPVAATKVLGEANLADALYATTRMLHAWKAPGWIDGEPYIDASYTCMCPAIELAELGYERVVAVSPETGPFYRDIYQARTIPAEWKGARLLFIQPDLDLKEIGVDYLSAQANGLQRAFDLGRTAGLRVADGMP
jgi:hypothetical protein